MHKIFNLKELSIIIGAELRGDGSKVITGLSDVRTAQSTDIACVFSSGYEQYLTSSKSGALVLSFEHSNQCSVDKNLLVMNNPYLGYAKISQLFENSLPKYFGTIAKGVYISPNSSVHPSVTVGYNAVIESGAIIEENVLIESGTVIGQNVRIGANTRIGSNVTICHGVVIGKDCRVYSNAVIGSDGFGHVRSNAGWQKIAQLGTVIIGNDVEVGSGTCIDRGSLGNTIIANGVRLDNLIHISHNVEIGEYTAIAANVLIAGSTIIGKNCLFSGGGCITGHIKIADNVHLNGATTVTKSIFKSGSYASGMGFMEVGHWRRTVARIRKLDGFVKKMTSELRKKVK